MIEFISSILAGIVIAGVTAFITVNLSLKRFREERWWERRAAAYENVIEALHHSKAFSGVHMDAELERRKVPEERDKELRAKSAQAHREIDRATDMAGFLLGCEARDRLRKYHQDTSDAGRADSWHEYLQLDWDVTNSCLKDLIEIARKDLKTGAREKA
ncbi:hypothetical protein [Idiomarina ramblicola]|uniref:DUF2489 domain-containing protein n=1 Tax=Idiomarina ramblicola TaxID=263724 RepID=A0A432Z1D8_9GAMM|nr:hypothetical protein [Idiomarina ramblicola]RUO71653.1 hypothetical protein CWI78_03825 [Idiomarina ramblicola]